MTSKEAKTHIIDTLNGDMNKEYFINELLPEILKDLERLEEIENLRTTPKALETCLANYMNKCIDLEKENQELKEENKVLEACIKDWEDDYEHLEFYFKNREKALEILKKYLYYDNKNHAIKMKEVRKSIYNFDYEDLKEMLECQKR